MSKSDIIGKDAKSWGSMAYWILSYIYYALKCVSKKKKG